MLASVSAVPSVAGKYTRWNVAVPKTHFTQLNNCLTLPILHMCCPLVAQFQGAVCVRWSRNWDWWVDMRLKIIMMNCRCSWIWEVFLRYYMAVAVGEDLFSAAFLLKSSFQSVSATVSSGVTITRMRPERKMSVQWHHRLLRNVRLHFSSLWHILSLWNPN